MSERITAQAREFKFWLRFTATFTVCVLLTWLSYQISSDDLYVKIIWIPAGAALVAVWRWGYGMLPAVALAELIPPLHLIHLSSALCGAAGAVFEAALTVVLLRRLNLRPEFDRVRDGVWFSLVAVIACPAVAAAFVACLFIFSGTISFAQFWVTGFIWWIGDAFGILTLSPLLLTLGSARHRHFLQMRWREFLALSACWGLVDLWIFHASGLPQDASYPLSALFDPLLLWAALRFGPAGIALMCPVALLQQWGLQPGGSAAFPLVSFVAPASFPLVHIGINWLTVLILASVIWELRGAEAEFQRSHCELASLIDTLPLGIVAVDESNDVRHWNRAAEHLFGLSRSEVIGNPIPFSPTDELSGYLRTIHESGPLHGVDVSWRHPAREEVLRLRLYSSPHDGQMGTRRGGMALIADVTSQRALSHRLQQSKKLELVGRLAGGIAQDFHRLLSFIRDQLDLIRGEEGGTDLRDRIDEVHATVDRATNLTGQLLAFSRRQTIEPSIVDLNDAIRVTLPLLRRLAGADIQLETGLAPFLGRVAINQAQLEQILLNLVVNARDAMQSAGKIEVAAVKGAGSLHDVENPENYACLIVSDSGCGMSAAVQARIFEPFFTTKEVGRGSGLGLATVYGIVQQVGGQIRVWSQPGAGSRFEILLPRIPSEVPARS